MPTHDEWYTLPSEVAYGESVMVFTACSDPPDFLSASKSPQYPDDPSFPLNAISESAAY